MVHCVWVGMPRVHIHTTVRLLFYFILPLSLPVFISLLYRFSKSQLDPFNKRLHNNATAFLLVLQYPFLIPTLIVGTYLLHALARIH